MKMKPPVAGISYGGCVSKKGEPLEVKACDAKALKAEGWIEVKKPQPKKTAKDEK